MVVIIAFCHWLAVGYSEVGWQKAGLQAYEPLSKSSELMVNDRKKSSSNQPHEDKARHGGGSRSVDNSFSGNLNSVYLRVIFYFHARY